VDALLVLDDLAEAEVGVLGAGRRAAPPAPARLAPCAKDELHLGGEQDDERQPEGHPFLQAVGEEPRKHEDECGDPHDELNATASRHSATVRLRLRDRVAPCRPP
jgi:hypothetical protein